MIRRWLLGVIVGLGLSLALRAEVKLAQGTALPNQIGPHVFVLPHNWAGRLPPQGAVNVPVWYKDLAPGQAVSVGLLAQGPAHESQFDGVTVNLTIKSADRTILERRGLRPQAARRVKGEGADMALMALKAGGVSEADLAHAADAMALMAVAVFPVDWTVPADQTGELEFAVEVVGAAQPVKTEPTRVPVKTVTDWLKAPPPTEQQVGNQLRGYQAVRSTGELLAWFNVVAKSRMLKASPVQAFFAYAFNADASARATVIAAYPQLEPAVQSALLWVLRLGGADVRAMFPTETAETLAPFKALAPLADPRQLPQFHDPVDVQAAASIGQVMDRCWAGWMATGDQSYLRPLVDLLAGAGDYPSFEAWTKAKGGAKGLNAQVARGMTYQIAGWSIGSFERSDPLVADWLAYWQNDPATPDVVRREIGTLLTNPAFRRR